MFFNEHRTNEYKDLTKSFFCFIIIYIKDDSMRDVNDKIKEDLINMSCNNDYL